MIEFTMRIAGCTAAVTATHESTKAYCHAYLCAAEPDFAVQIAPEDICFERKKSKQEDMLEGRPVRELSDRYLETIAVQRKIAEQLFSFNTLLFHGSAIAVDGEGYLFTARSGTGKSTHTRLWRELFGERAVMINDDKPFLGFGENGVKIYGSPWNGKHGLGSNLCVPLKAICILERGDENSIQPISALQALPMLMQQSHRPGNKLNFPKYMELIDGLASGAAFYRLVCNMEPAAAAVAYEGMKSREI